MQGVARATVQMSRRMREREQRELEREQLQINKDRREREIRMKRNREMIERERREMRRSRREWQEAGEQCNKRRYFLAWKMHIYYICTKISKSTGMLYEIRFHVPRWSM